MGKPTGFLEYKRMDNSSCAPEERIRNFNEFHRPLSPEEREAPGGPMHELRRPLLPVWHCS